MLRTYPHYGRQPWHPQFLVEALRASRRLKALDEVDLTVSETTQLAFPSKAEALREELRLTGLKSPSRFVLARARVQLDAVLMLARREANARAGVHRQLMFDASPRKGIELFACREIVTVRGDVRGSPTRTLPSTSLGVGHFSLEDEALALAHSLLLETGFSYVKARHVCNSVRVALLDSGVERLGNDVLDVIQLALDGNCRPERLAALSGTYMFPLSIWVPEGNHLWDLILRTVLFNIP
jgi:predicted short-subunit dehydrogenase-like oxidoreductase (DUF2520 family)